MKRILLIATGGTITCRDTGHGLAPALTGAELLSLAPEAAHFCTVQVRDLLQIDSTDLTAADGITIARAIWESYPDYDGFVITHGTDTLAYTAALLYHMLRGTGKPVVLTGSMLPAGVSGSDAPRNLRDALRTAASEAGGVFAVLNGNIIRGNRVSKRHSSALDAFASVGAPPAGTIDESGALCWAEPPEAYGAPSFLPAKELSVPVLHLTPSLAPEALAVMRRFPRVILAGFGAGGIPQRLEQALRELIAGGTRVYITTQCAEGGADLQKYAVGQRAAALGAVSLGTRTIEDALAAMQCGEL